MVETVITGRVFYHGDKGDGLMTDRWTSNGGTPQRVPAGVLTTDVHNPDRKVVQTAAQIVLRGGVIAYPTDTIYGLGGDPFNPAVVHRILEMKGRPATKGMLVLVPDPFWVDTLVSRIPEEFFPLAAEFWPGPVTLLMKGCSELPDSVLSEEGKVGLRHPDLPFLDALLKKISGPLISTSANLSGEPYRWKVEELIETFRPLVDLIITAREDKRRRPSTVVDLTVKPPRIVREGRRTKRIQHRLDMLNLY
jgi:L-threonylcarbamoyladenylate synthase